MLLVQIEADECLTAALAVDVVLDALAFVLFRMLRAVMLERVKKWNFNKNHARGCRHSSVMELFSSKR